jgi:O-acetyl-ADP-ribose deacetylase (regulator of RNase III)
MSARGRPEPTATATLTGGYSLPAKHVIHTVGPVVEGQRPSPEERALLARCYEECLRVCADAGLRSIGFCAISTGVFGYPPMDAAPVALETVRAFLAHDARLESVVFVTFTPSDRAVYASALERR